MSTNHKETEQLEAQAKYLAGLLDVHAQRLSMRTLKKLEDARGRAVNLHQKHQGITVNADGTFSQWTTWMDQHRMIFASLILVVAISSFVVLQHLSNSEASDAFLLGADLPPEAFVDQGFEPSLNKHASI